ncbi:MAG: hypothetical protein ACOC33_02155 [bacterium]
MRFNDFYYLTEKSYWKDKYEGISFYVRKTLSIKGTKEILDNLLENNIKLTRISKPKTDDNVITVKGKAKIDPVYFSGEDGKIYKFEGISSSVLIDEESLDKFDASKYENLIVLWHNKIKNPDMSEERLRELSGLSDSKYNALYKKITEDEEFKELGEKYASKTSNEIEEFMFQTGRSSIELTDFWKEHGGVDMTPKTDVTGGDKKLSMKKTGGSQLLSAVYGESNATFAAALTKMGNSIDPSLTKKLETLRDKTRWSDIDTGQQKLDVNEVKKMFPDELQTELNKTKKNRDNEKIVLGLNQFVADQSRNPVISQIVSGMILNSQLDELLQDTLQTDKQLKYYFTEEAMTGSIKFGKESLGSANNMLVFDINGNLKISEINKEIIEKYAKKVKYNISYKSSGKKIYSVVRGTTKDVIKQNEKYSINDMDLITEGIISDLLDLGKSVLNKIIQTAKDFFDFITNFLLECYRRVVDFIINISNRGYNALISFLGIEDIEVYDNNPTININDF